jgi:hypothetical protein
MKCCLCNEDIKPNAAGWDGGNNALPLADGRCCTECNEDVIIARMIEMGILKVIDTDGAESLRVALKEDKIT